MPPSGHVVAEDRGRGRGRLRFAQRLEVLRLLAAEATRGRELGPWRLGRLEAAAVDLRAPGARQARRAEDEALVAAVAGAHRPRKRHARHAATLSKSVGALGAFKREAPHSPRLSVRDSRRKSEGAAPWSEAMWRSGSETLPEKLFESLETMEKT